MIVLHIVFGCPVFPYTDYLRAVRGFSILSLIAALVSLVLSLLAVNEDGTKLKLAAALAVFITGKPMTDHLPCTAAVEPVAVECGA